MTRLYTSEFDVFRRQILTSKVGPRTYRINMGLMLTRRLRHWPNIKPTLDNRFSSSTFAMSLNWIANFLPTESNPILIWPEGLST